MTIREAQLLKVGDVVHFGDACATVIRPNGRVRRYAVRGTVVKVQVWKGKMFRNRVRVTVVEAAYSQNVWGEESVSSWHHAEDCPQHA